MNPKFLKAMRIKIRDMRDIGVVYKEAKEPPKKLTIGTMIIRDPNFPDHGLLSFFADCPMLYPMGPEETRAYEILIERYKHEYFPHLGEFEKHADSGDIWKKDKDGSWLISDDEITRRHKIFNDIFLNKG